MGKAFGCLAFFIVAYLILKWPVPSLAVLGILFVACYVYGNEAGSRTTKTTMTLPTKPATPKKQGQTTMKEKTPIKMGMATMPSMRELLYPEKVPTFAELEDGEHNDLRALIYTIATFDKSRKRPFSDGEINYLDFGKKSSAYSALKKARLIQPLELPEEIVEVFTRDELVELARERGLPHKGSKRALADRLAESGYKIDRRKHRGHLFRLTEKGTDSIDVYENDRRNAISCAIAALKELDYQKAITAYHQYDRKWGFAHTSGKIHTIFAYYDVPCSQFKYIMNYPMRELKNTEDFKATLRACLLAGFMRGCKDKWELTVDFKAVCKEKINCPRLLSLFDYDRVVLQNMKQQIEFDSDNALKYYISHLLYLCRRWG